MKAMTSATALAWAIGIAAAPGMAGAASAQDAATVVDDSSGVAAEQDSGGIEILLTAQRREQNLNDVPISVAVTSGETLQRANINNLEALSLRTPSVRIAQAPASDQMHIRGTGSGFNPGFEQSVATFVDGVYRGRARSSRAALFDVERVEILKGPQTTYFGNNAIAGAFNIVSRRPEFDFRYNASALYVPVDGEYSLEAGVTAPLGETLAARAALRLSGMDGYIENTRTGDDGPHLRDMIGRVALRFEPSDNWRSDLRVDIGRNRDKSTLSAEITSCPPPAEFGGPRGYCARYLGEYGEEADTTLDYSSTAGPSKFDYDMTEIAFSNSIMLGDHELALISSYFEHEMEVYTDVLPFPYAGVFGAPFGADVMQAEDFKQYTQEVRLSSPTGGRIEYMLGAYFLRGDLDMAWNTGYWFAPFSNLPPIAAAGFPANSPVAHRVLNKQRETTLSGFGALTFNATDRLRAILGARYSHVTKKATRDAPIGIARDPLFADFVEVSPEAQAAAARIIGLSIDPFPIAKREDDKFMPSAVVQYDVTDDVMAYASYTNGFKAGGYGFSTADVFGPESVDAYEIGLKGSLANRSVNFNVAMFWSDYKDLQEATQVLIVNDPTTPNDDAFKSVVANSAASRSRGIEFGMQWRASPLITLHGDVAYLDSKYRDYPGAPCRLDDALTTANCSTNMGGVRRTFSPEWSGSFGANVRIPVAELEVRLDPSMYFTSRYFQQIANGDPLLSQPAYAKFDMRVGIGPADGRWEFALVGKNLTDRTTASYRQVVPTANGTVQALADRPRSVGVQLTVRN